MKCLTLFLSLGIASCASAPVDTPIGCPPGPDLEPINQELWITIPKHVRYIMVRNAREWEEWYDSACGRIEAHDKELTE